MWSVRFLGDKFLRMEPSLELPDCPVVRARQDLRCGWRPKSSIYRGIVWSGRAAASCFHSRLVNTKNKRGACALKGSWCGMAA
jgi:hypothetical protein